MEGQMKNMHSSHILAAAVGLMLCAPALPYAAQQKTEPDNTGVNKRDQSPDSKTADQQSNDRADLELARRIRQSIVNDKSLSTYAHNIKIVAVAGKVTLKGPVKTGEEKTTVETKAREIAGASNVVSQLEVAPNKAAADKPSKPETCVT
jgi:hyperosmotically inducible periplasmic protein